MMKAVWPVINKVIIKTYVCVSTSKSETNTSFIIKY